MSLVSYTQVFLQAFLHYLSKGKYIEAPVDYMLRIFNIFRSGVSCQPCYVHIHAEFVKDF